MTLPIRLSCAGCGTVVGADTALPFACPRAGDGDEHVLTRRLDTGAQSKGTDWWDVFLDPEPNPFLRYRPLFYAYHHALAKGLSDADYVTEVRRLDHAVAAVSAMGFRETPFAPAPALGKVLGLGPDGALWVKDETRNVSGSHKARHLFGILIWLELQDLTDSTPTDSSLAIASCGNAALAAAEVARAAERPLEVFLPPDANPQVVDRLSFLGARLIPCPRDGSSPGDPCYVRFREAVDAGSLPFTVQGNENALTLEGGLTLGYEMVSELLRRQATIDSIFIQVGGGALASSVIQGLREATFLGLRDRIPRVFTVQPEGVFPLHRAYRRVADRILGTDTTAYPPDPVRDGLIADAVSATAPDRISEALRYAAAHRAEFMWAWEQEPHSVATGILDDETYDWLADVRGMLETGGFPLVATEELLREAHDLAHRHTTIDVEPTGSAGLAGCLTLRRADLLSPETKAAALFTGIER